MFGLNCANCDTMTFEQTQHIHLFQINTFKNNSSTTLTQKIKCVLNVGKCFTFQRGGGENNNNNNSMAFDEAARDTWKKKYEISFSEIYYSSECACLSSVNSFKQFALSLFISSSSTHSDHIACANFIQLACLHIFVSIRYISLQLFSFWLLFQFIDQRVWYDTFALVNQCKITFAPRSKKSIGCQSFCWNVRR